MKSIAAWILGVFLFIPSILFSQSYKEIYEKIRESAGKGDSKAIMEWIDKAIEKSKNDYQKNTDEHYGLVCEKIAIVLDAKARINPKAYEFEAMYLEEALRVHKANIKKYQNNYIMVGYQLGILYRKISQYANAISVLEEVLPMLEKSQGKDNDNYINFKYELAQSYRMSGKYLLAKKCIDEVFSFTEKNHAKDIEMVNVLQERGAYYATIGLYEQAEQDYRKSIELVNNEPKLEAYKNTRMLDAIGELGKLYVEMGKYTQAEDLLLYELSRRSLPENATPTERKDYSQLLNSIATLYVRMGRYENALKLAVAATDQIEKAYGKNHVDYYVNCETLAQIYLYLGIYEKSLNLYLECKDGIKSILGESHVYYGLIVNNLAECYNRMGKALEAKQNFELAKNVYEQSKLTETPFYAMTVNNIAVIEIELKNYVQAEKMLTQALELTEKYVGKNHPNYQIILSNLSVLCSMNGKTDKAKAYALQSKNHYIYQIQSVFPTMTEKEKLEFVSVVETFFNAFSVVATKNSDKQPELVGELYNTILAIKGVATNSSIRTRQKILNSGDTKLINMYHEWQKTNQMIAKGATLSEQERKNLGINLDSLSRVAQSLSRDIAYLSRNITNDIQISPTWQDIQKKLMPGEAAIEVKKQINPLNKNIDSSEYAILIITPDSKNPDLVILKNGNLLENGYYTAYARSTRNKLLDEESYNVYWAPIAKKLTGVKRVYFSPDGVYNKISLLGLYNPANKRYLIEETEIVLLSNTRELLNQKPNKTVQWGNANAVLVYNPTFNANIPSDGKNKERGNVEGLAGNKNLQEITRFGTKLMPLPGTGQEGEKIKQILQSKKMTVQTFNTEGATEQCIKSQNSPSILHIATHGFFLPIEKMVKIKSHEDVMITYNPMFRSGLYLAGATHPEAGKNKDDGILTAFEIQNMNLENTELVVLSACETGLGETSLAGGFTQLVTNGEGVFGLQRAFRVAGAKSIIMSLWKVNDEATQLLMTKFYENWQVKGMEKRTAFYLAQQELRKEYKEPYYWAAFVMFE